MDDDEVDRFLAKLYKDFPTHVAKQISKDERRAQGYTSTTLVYGEIDFGAFRRLFLSILKQHHVLTKAGGVFLDIGCGSGRPVFAAALLHDFDQVVGYEILPRLTEVARQVAEIWHLEKKALHEHPLKKRTRVVIENVDATKIEWPAADMIFCNSTCFDERLMRALTKQTLASLKPGGVVITATKPLVEMDDLTKLTLVETCSMHENWGDATMYIYKRD
ncbi:unnamed protein product [Aphanomyces euteiches]|nr:hypothetical protein Ae201684P_020624 [Aphanomyces euteiches]KAH9133593.1 hypothetical protein AeRB84_020374 [Aphanomyces euteiches]